MNALAKGQMAIFGAVRLHITHLSGLVNSILPGQTDITLNSIDRRGVEIFDFAGTGTSTETDADPDNYEVATGNLLMQMLGTGKLKSVDEARALVRASFDTTRYEPHNPDAWTGPAEQFAAL